MTPRHLSTPLLAILLSVSNALLSSVPCAAQEKFPDSSEVSATPLQESVLQQLQSFVLPPSGPPTKETQKEHAKVRELLCKQQLTSTGSSNESVKAALAITESDLAAEIKFKKGSGARPTEADTFSLYVEFGKQDVLIRSSLPRFDSDRSGVRATFPTQGRRLAWLEGKQGSDVLLIFPDLRECNTQAVAICPRIYVPRGTLGTTSYSPNAIRFMGAAKGDGLFALGSGKIGKVQASILGSKGLVLPSPWFKIDTGSTPAATIKYNTIKNEVAAPPPFVDGEVPLIGTTETRLDFGSESESLRKISLRTNMQVSKFEFPEGDQTTVRSALLNIEKGSCYLVTRWQEHLR